MPPEAAPFKRCSLCATVWATRSAFVDDPETTLIGYQAFVEDGVPGLFLFNHESCGTTMAIKLEAMRDLYDGPAGQYGRVEPEHDSEYCLTSREGACPATCECALVRHVIDEVGPKAEG